MPVLASLQRGVSGEMDDCMCGASLETTRVLGFALLAASWEVIGWVTFDGEVIGLVC
jgi:hypothetical protein